MLRYRDHREGGNEVSSGLLTTMSVFFARTLSRLVPFSGLELELNQSFPRTYIKSTARRDLRAPVLTVLLVQFRVPLTQLAPVRDSLR